MTRAVLSGQGLQSRLGLDLAEPLRQLQSRHAQGGWDTREELVGIVYLKRFEDRTAFVLGMNDLRHGPPFLGVVGS